MVSYSFDPTFGGQMNNSKFFLIFARTVLRGRMAFTLIFTHLKVFKGNMAEREVWPIKFFFVREAGHTLAWSPARHRGSLDKESFIRKPRIFNEATRHVFGPCEEAASTWRKNTPLDTETPKVRFKPRIDCD